MWFNASKFSFDVLKRIKTALSAKAQAHSE
jgi:hypothetical protein